MNKEKQKTALSAVEGLVPELRFPEFENDGDWEEKKLDEVCEVNPSNKNLPEEFVYIDLESVKSKKLLKKNIINLDDAPSRAQRLLKNEDVIFQMVRPYQKNNYFFKPEDNLEYVASTGYAQLRAFESKMYLFQYIHNDNFVNRVLDKCTGSNYPAINSGGLSKIRVEIPKPKEQQKIANCLSSLDNLITTETEKLDHLKDHKKGLLQQLFPAKGETKPQFRFSEFKNDGDWIETILDDVADYANGKAHEKEISETGKYKVVNSKFISTDGRVVKFTDSANLKANVGDILMVLSDIPNGKAIAKCFYVEKEDTYTVNQRICKITPTGIDNKFLFYIQNRNSYFLAFDDGVKQTNLRKDTVLSFPFLKPKSTKEQQKIANCLSCADDLIEAQKVKIKALKKHKKGLMQQLFPNSL
ncbi:restriction endonuclease subunit S [Formosa sp. 3Alg 14/1]|uniref:restriction endonuclease subunit S n=1 Tax=Formosa sp. 3Alg 14/1 TaxID=3382190 RepID=UPI0039BE2B83